jgi:TusA-related sulfurtransferase
VNVAPELSADRFYDAGDQGCAGPGLKEIRDLMEALHPGQTLEIRTVSDVGRTDLEAWIRLRGHELVEANGGANGDRVLVRKGSGP